MIVRPFNAGFWLIAALTAAVLVLLYVLGRGKTQRQREKMLLALCAFNLVFYFVYKGLLSQDAEFLLVKGMDEFNWFDELPLQLCNINLFLIPLGILTKKRPILGFSFFFAPLGALLAMASPNAPFVGFSLALPRMIGYYGTHALLIVCGLALAVLNIYRPRRRDMGGILAALLALAVCMHGVNTLLRATVCPQANYFYTYYSDISLIRLMWRLIPVPLLYQFSGLLPLAGYMLAVSYAFERGENAHIARLQSEKI